MFDNLKSVNLKNISRFLVSVQESVWCFDWLCQNNWPVWRLKSGTRSEHEMASTLLPWQFYCICNVFCKSVSCLSAFRDHKKYIFEVNFLTCLIIKGMFPCLICFTYKGAIKKKTVHQHEWQSWCIISKLCFCIVHQPIFLSKSIIKHNVAISAVNIQKQITLALG